MAEIDDQPRLNISNLEMDIDFQTEKRVGKRFHISEDEEEEVSKQYPIPFKLTPGLETGDCLMEVFRVIVNREGHISGKIFVDNRFQFTDIYKAEEEEYVSRGGDLLLPGAVVPTINRVRIFADLNHKTKNYRITRFNQDSYSEESRRLNNYDECLDEEGIFNEARYRGFYWHYLQPEGQRLLNKPLSHKITRGNLTATLLFAFFNNAILATVEVRLINESSAKNGVYGLITARNSMLEDRRYNCILFRKNFTERVPLVPEDPIQLSRSVLAVPVEFNLIVHVDLRSKDTKIPCGELTFPVPVKLCGMSEKLLGDKVQVKVTWKHYWMETLKKKDLSVRISKKKEDVSKQYPIPLKLTPAIETYIETQTKYFNSIGDCLMEVFRVIVNREGHISGKIFINTGPPQMTDIYKAEEEYVTKGGDLLLPGTVLPTLDGVLIFADLNYKTKKSKSYRSTRFNKGSYSEESRRLNNYDECLDEEGRFNEARYMGFYWHYLQPEGQRLLNKPLSHKITRGNLTATLLFAFFHSAILATIEVRLINESSENIGVYGLIEARNNMFEDPRYKCILFRKTFTKRVPLVPEDPIQLSRSVLAVPVEFNLIVRVHLSSKDTNIPRGELTFPVPAELRGMSEKLLGDKVQVKVTWKHYWK